MKPQSTTRRRFLKSSSALAGALVIGFWLPETRGRFEARAQPQAKTPIPPNAFVRVGKDGSVTVLVKHLEFGQGVNTALPMMVAEELDCDWSRVRSDLAPAGPEYAHTGFGMQMTGGSSSVPESFDQMRTAGAQARLMLMQAAANQWKVKVDQVHTARGFVIGPGGRKLAYGQLVDAAAKLPMPDKVTLKKPGQFALIGKPMRRLDSRDKVTGQAQFGLDVKRQDLHTAVVAHAPVFGAKVRSFNADKVKAVNGVTHVIETAHGVAVVATSFWSAKKGRDALEVDWDLGPVAALSTESLRTQYRQAAAQPPADAKVARKAEHPDAMKGAAKTIVAEYEVPFLAHAPMEPLNCTVEVRGDSAELWVGSQFQTVDQAAAAKVLGLQPSQVKLNTMLAGGGFGRRANPVSDYVVEACEIAKQAKVPVKTIWTREDDIRGGFYRPMYVHRVEVGLDAQGAIAAWNHVIVGSSIVGGTPFEAMMVKDGVDPTSVEGVADTPYEIANMQVTLDTTRPGVPVLWWRSVGHSHSAFVMETMIDELAAAANKDPVAYRRGLLAKNPKMLGVLELAASKSGWGAPLPAGRARGIAVHESFGSACAQVAEVSLEGDEVRVHRVVAAFDCGLVVNPMTVEAQVQGAIAYGLSAALMGEITLKDGRVQQSNFHDYRVLRLPQMPRVEVFLVPGGEKPTGVGEPATPPIAPAVANALFALTGKRVRKLPLGSTQSA
ncbi:MAG TPA: xanthine dehydrogenase family protein molybdopterin-binding subunit [Usitatibacter sp.]|jgi:isoquinoline 1-oxidoreductase beta subunit|nr:xanthine dehydrogenase family protein molybdopterin-binding subunit [Usitatibacter sp.]